MAVDALGRGYNPVALIDPTTGLPATIGGGGGGGATGSVGSAGTNGTVAQSVQGINGGVPQPVTASSLPLPAGAATASNQNATAAGTSATSAQAVQGVTNGVPVPVAVVSGGGGGSGAVDGVLTTYSITSTGAQPGLSGAGYGGAFVEMQGAGTATIELQTSSDSTDGVNGTWTTTLGSSPDSSSADGGVSTSTRRRFYEISSPWIRVIATSLTSTVTVYLTRKVFIPKTKAVVISGVSFVAITGGSSVIGSTTLRSIGTNRSTTVGTAAVTLMAANAGRQGWKIKNDSAGDLWINFDTTATAAAGGGNIKIAAGAYLASEPGFVETGAMSAIGSAAGLNITAREH